MKNPNIYLKEYSQCLSDDQLKFLNQRLGQKLGGDIAEALDFLSNVKEIDRWLSSAESPDDLFDMVDMVGESIIKEDVRRNS